MNRMQPLTPEERELAQLLGRSMPSTPSAALDEAVLAAARAALQPRPGVHALSGAGTDADADAAVAAPSQSAWPRLRPRSRLPAALGLAASVVFAVGIAWQLKPDVPVQMQAAPAAMPTDPAADAVPAADEVAKVAEVAEDSAASADHAVAARTATAPAARSAKATAAEPAPVMPPTAAREQAAAAPLQAPVPVAAPMPPAPPAAAAAAPATDSYRMQRADPRAADIAEIADITGGERARQDADAPQAAPKSIGATRSVGAPGVMRRDAPLPSGALSASAVDAAVAADAALPRKQWLKRIRERRDAGDLDTARASLEHYLQQYPETRVPRDIGQLLDN